MVGWFVKKQYLGFKHKCACQKHAASHAAGQSVENSFRAYLYLLQYTLCHSFNGPAIKKVDVVLKFVQKFRIG